VISNEDESELPTEEENEPETLDLEDDEDSS